MVYVDKTSLIIQPRSSLLTAWRLWRCLGTREQHAGGGEQWTNKTACVWVFVWVCASVAVLHCLCPCWSSQELFVPCRRSHVTIFEQLDVMFACLLCWEIWSDKPDCENVQSRAEKHPGNVSGHVFLCLHLLLLLLVAVVHCKPVSDFNLHVKKIDIRVMMVVEQSDWQFYSWPPNLTSVLTWHPHFSSYITSSAGAAALMRLKQRWKHLLARKGTCNKRSNQVLSVKQNQYVVIVILVYNIQFKYNISHVWRTWKDVLLCFNWNATWWRW